MKRILAILLCCFLVFIFAACDAADNASGNPTDNTSDGATNGATNGTSGNTTGDEDANSMNVENLGDTMSYHITRVYTSDQLLPENTDGFHKYYEASEGNTLFIVEMDIKNISDDLYRIWLLGEAKLSIAEEVYEAKIAVKLDGMNDGFGNGNVEINSDESYHVYYLFDIPKEHAGEQAVLTMTSNAQTKSHDVKAE